MAGIPVGDEKCVEFGDTELEEAPGKYSNLAHVFFLFYFAVRVEGGNNAATERKCGCFARDLVVSTQELEAKVDKRYYLLFFFFFFFLFFLGYSIRSHRLR